MQLYAHQQRLVDQNPSRYGLWHEVGTGKTITAISLAKKNARRVLVVCPKSIKQQWYNQIRFWTDGLTLDWAVVTKEEFRRDWLKLDGYDCLIVDEAHFFGNAKSQLHKNAMKWLKANNPEFIYLLTGTPYLSSVMNIYAYECLLGRKPSWYAYMQRFFMQVRMGARLVPLQRKGIEGEVSEILHTIGNTVKLEDCVDVPEQVYETEYFELGKEQERAIEEMALTESTPIARWSKTHEICGGTLKSTGYTEEQIFPCEKVQRLQELVEQYPKLVVVCRYTAEVNMLCRFFPSTVKIDGSVKDRHHQIARAEKMNRCMLVVQAACSEGWEAPSFPMMVFYSYDFSLKNTIQMRGRIQRVNAVKRNVYLSLVMRDTIDEDILKCVERKEDFHIQLYKSV